MVDPGTGIGGSSQDIPVGKSPPSDPEFYFQWAKENAKESIKRADTALGQLLTLSTTLLGGAIAFWDRMPIGSNFKLLVVGALLFTVLVCLFAVMPISGRSDVRSASDIRDHMRDVFDLKLKRLNSAKWSLTVALLMMMLGLIAGALK